MIERGYDNDFFKSIALDPKVWPHISDDGCSKYFDFPENGIYLIAKEDLTPVGFFMIEPINSVCVEVHTVFSPSAFGRVESHAKDLICWVFENTSYKKIITFVPEDNKKAKRLAEKVGMQVEGLISKSYQRNGKLLDQFILGVCKCQLFR